MRVGRRGGVYKGDHKGKCKKRLNRRYVCVCVGFSGFCVCFCAFVINAAEQT